MKTTEKQIIDFDALGYDGAIADLAGFTKNLNQRPYEGTDPMSLRQLAQNRIVNESFCTGAVKIGLTPSLELLKKVLNKSPQILKGIVVDLVLAELNKQDIHEALKRSILQSYEPDELDFISVIERLSQSYSFMARPKTGQSTVIQQIENYLTFKDGLAIVTDETKESIKELFTIKLDTPDRSEIYSLLVASGEAITRLNAKLVSLDKFYTPVTFDSEYFYDDGVSIIPRNDIIKYF